MSILRLIASVGNAGHEPHPLLPNIETDRDVAERQRTGAR